MSTPQQQQLRSATGSANWCVLYCPDCPPGTLADHHHPNAQFWWAVQLSCSTCSKEWTICKECPRMRQPITDRAQASRHHHKKHYKQQPPPESSSAKRPKLDLPSSPSAPPKNPPPALVPGPPQTIKVTIPPSTMLRPQSRKFFEADCNGDGLSFLACLANFGRTDVMDQVKPREVARFFRIAGFSAGLSRPQRDELSEIFFDIETDPSERYKSNKSTTSQWRIPLPTTPQQIRSVIVEGKNSVFENLPHPQIHEIGEYAYCLPSDCLADLFAHGIVDIHKSLPKFHNKSTITQGLGTCEAAKRITGGREDKRDGGPDLFIFLGFWSDGFEPLNSKQNRASAWIKTMSVHTENPDHSFLPLTHVYPVAIGPKGNDHDIVERILQDDVDKLQNTFTDLYDGSKRSIRTTMTFPLVILQDQPERRGFARLMLGNSNYHAQFGVSFDFSQCVDVLCPCTACFANMQETIAEDDWVPPYCNNCTNWAVRPDHPLLVFKAPPDFPLEETLSDKEGYLPMTKLTFPMLQEAVQKAHDMVVSRQWTTANAISFLRVKCLNSFALEEFKTCAENCRLYSTAKDNDDEDLLLVLDEEKRSSPSSFERWASPVSWELGLEMYQLPEVTMHLLKGIISSNLAITHSYLRSQKKFAEYLRTIRPLTDQIKALHLSWLPVEPYTSAKLGGWVSENYFGYTRIITWAVSHIRGMDMDEPYVPPDKPQSKWTKVENTAWLAARFLETKGNAMELRQRVRDYLSMATPPPIPPASGGPVESLEAAAISLYHFVAYMMQMSQVVEGTGRVVARLVRLYLTRLYHLDKNLRASDQLPCWLSAYNHLCLLNLEEQISQLGPPRNRWEGKYMGEGYLTHVKPYLHSPSRKFWTRNLMLNLARQRSLQVMKVKREVLKGITEIPKPLSSLDDYLVYASRVKLFSDFEKRKPLSAVAVEGDNLTLFSVVRENNTMLYFQFKFASPVIVLRSSLHDCYYHLDLSDRPWEHAPTATASCVLLPYPLTIQSQNDPDGFFTIIDSTWRAVNDNKKLVLPHTIACEDAQTDLNMQAV